MNVHDGIIRSFVSVYHGICVKTDNQVVAHLAGFLQEIQVPNVE